MDISTKKKQKEQIKDKIKKAENTSTCTKKLLQICKTWMPMHNTK